MRTIEVNLYSFDELSDEAKKKALDKLCDINTNYDWWDYTYDDAVNIGLKITAFDIRYRVIEGEFMLSAPECAERIIEQHGKDCTTSKTAQTFLRELNDLTSGYDNIEDCPEDEIEDLENSFLEDLLGDYLKILRDEYDYQCSEEAIVETIQANDYEFTEDGKLA